MHPAPTPARRAGPVAGRLGSVGRARMGYMSCWVCADVSEFSGEAVRGGAEGIPPPPDLGQGLRDTGEIPAARGPRRGCLQSL